MNYRIVINGFAVLALCAGMVSIERPCSGAWANRVVRNKRWAKAIRIMVSSGVGCRFSRANGASRRATTDRAQSVRSPADSREPGRAELVERPMPELQPGDLLV